MKIRVGFGAGVAAGAALDASGFWEMVDALEEMSWDSIWFSERVHGNLHDPLAAMAAVAGRTRHLKFGMSVLVLPGRNPVLLAKELATIDVLSGGRLVPAFGLGSDFPSEHAVFGVERAERAGRTDEAILLMKRLWSEESVSHEGRYYRVDDIKLGPKPVQRPHPDVWLGGHSPAALKRTGRVGDGWLPSFVAPSEYRAAAELIRATAAEHDRAIDDEHFGVLVPYLPESAGEAAPIFELLARRRPEIDPRDIVPAGRAALRAQLERFLPTGASKFVVVTAVPPADWLDELEKLHAEVVAPLEN